MRLASFAAAAALVVLVGYQSGKQASWFLLTHVGGPRQHEAAGDSDAGWSESQAAAATRDITIVSFTDLGMVDFAFNWLHHLRIAIGPDAVSSSLLMYAVGEETRRALVGSGLVPEHCIRDGAFGSMDPLEPSAQGLEYQSSGFNRLTVQRPRILLAAMAERGVVSTAVLFSDIDAVWRADPRPQLHPLLGRAEVVGAQDTRLVGTGFFLLDTSNNQIPLLLSDWEQALSAGVRAGHFAFNDLLKAYSELRVHRLAHEQFPSGYEFFHQGRHAETALVIHANYFRRPDTKRKMLRAAGVWAKAATRQAIPERQPAPPPPTPPPPPLPVPVAAPPPPRSFTAPPRPPASASGAAITIISFTNLGMVDFALNWLHHLRIAVGPEVVSSSLLMYTVGHEAREVLIGSGLVPEHCIRDGAVGSPDFDRTFVEEEQKYKTPGFNKLAAQRPRIILHAIAERRHVSKAVLYSDVDAVWRKDPLPWLWPLADKPVVGAQDDYLVCTGFFMFSTSDKVVPALLEDWENSVAKGDKVNQWAFNEKLKAFPYLHVHLLEHELFPSGLEFFHKRKHSSTALVVHANYFQGQDTKREKLRSAGLWTDQPRPLRAR